MGMPMGHEQWAVVRLIWPRFDGVLSAAYPERMRKQSMLRLECCCTRAPVWG
jgi:hypothetical protein